MAGEHIDEQTVAALICALVGEGVSEPVLLRAIDRAEKLLALPLGDRPVPSRVLATGVSIFVNSMSDLFHEQILDDYIAEVLEAGAPWPVHR